MSEPMTLTQEAERMVETLIMTDRPTPAAVMRDLIKANAQLERERDEARLRAAEAVVAVNKFDRERMAEARLRYSMEKQRDAATAALAKAEGERDRYKDALVRVGEGYDRDAMPDHILKSEEAAIEAWNCPTPAYDAAIKAAEARGMERAAVIAEQREDDGEPAWAAWPDGADIASAIREAAGGGE